MSVPWDIGRWSRKCPCLSTWGRWVVKNGQNLVHVVCEWPLNLLKFLKFNTFRPILVVWITKFCFRPNIDFQNDSNRSRRKFESKTIEEGGLLIYEHFKDYVLPDQYIDFKKVRDKKYGDSRLSIYKLIGEPNE